VIEGEQHGVGYLFIYAAILAAIPPVAAFIDVSMTGSVGYRFDFVSGLI
jgi:hypothetical protein